MEGQRHLVGAKWQREVNRTFVVYNHKQNGTLLSQFFTTTEELPNSYSTKWQVIETAQQKIEGFSKSDWILNVTEIPEASSHEEAMELAKTKYGMKQIEPLGRK